MSTPPDDLPAAVRAVMDLRHKRDAADREARGLPPEEVRPGLRVRKPKEVRR